VLAPADGTPLDDTKKGVLTMRIKYVPTLPLASSEIVQEEKVV